MRYAWPPAIEMRLDGEWVETRRIPHVAMDRMGRWVHMRIARRRPGANDTNPKTLVIVGLYVMWYAMAGQGSPVQ